MESGGGDYRSKQAGRSWLELVEQQELYNYLAMAVEVNEQYTHIISHDIIALTTHNGNTNHKLGADTVTHNRAEAV